jgi:hypothetical protein
MIAMLLEWRGMDEAAYGALIERLGLRERMHRGALLHVGGPVPGGWRVVDVWDSEGAFEAFRVDALQPAMEQAGIGEPDFRAWPVHVLLTPDGPIAAPAPE